MKSKLIKALTVGAFVVGAATTAYAQQSSPTKQSVNLGKYEYDSHCAVCHGLNGAGEGPYSSFLSKTIPSLTTLSKRNGGVFPFDRVYETIDGRQELQAHGTRDMPIWGKDFSAMSIRGPYYNDEELAHAKILALTEYIYRLQAK
jgi:mono/diheme cytochrome c family protein